MKNRKLISFFALASFFIFCNFLECLNQPYCMCDLEITVTPEYGTVDTEFEFIASVSNCDCSFDYNNTKGEWCFNYHFDDKCDPDPKYHESFTNNLTIKYKYDEPGTYLVSCLFSEKDEGEGSGYITLTVTPASGSDPTATFSYSPLWGTTATVYSFDASNSSDVETPAEQLKVRWDWNGDGIWDTDPTKVKEAQHQFTTEGTYDVTLLVIDEDDATDQLTKQISVGAQTGDPCPGIPEVVYNGEPYPTVQIGDQCWLGKNLNVGKFLIANTTAQTDNNIIEKYCYDDLESNCEIYGGLYLWEEMMQYETTEGARGICPPDWHIPSRQDWNDLGFFLGSDNPGGALKALTHWKSPNTGATNETGFSALPGGWCDGYGSGDYTFVFLTEIASFHGSYISGASYGGKELFYNGGNFPWHEDTPLKSARSVRCIMNKQ